VQYGPRAGHWTWFAIAIVAALVLAQVLLALTVGRLTQPENLLLSQVSFRLPAGGPSILAQQMENLPLVPHDLPDEESQSAAAAYAAARFDQPAGFAGMFQHAWQGLRADPADAAAIALLREQLAFNLRNAPDDDFRRAAAAALPALQSDPRNGDRLALVGVSIFELGIAIETTNATDAVAVVGRPLGSPENLRRRAILLLQTAAPQFSSNRALALNLAYLGSSTPSSCYPSLFSVFTAIEPLSQWLIKQPDDVTGRLLLASLRSRTAYQPAELAQALKTLDPIVSDSGLAALGHAARGDAELSVATRRTSSSPFYARVIAQAALGDYERALEGGHDAGLFAGLAAALDLLGRHSDAVETQQRATQIEPKSAVLQLGLVTLQWHAADFTGARSTARSALTLSLASPPPLASESRLLPGSDRAGLGYPVPGDRPFLGWSLGSERPHIGVTATSGGCGGGYVVQSELVPAVPDAGEDDSRRIGDPASSAVIAEIEASVVLADPDTARQDEFDWLRKVTAGLSLADVINGVGLPPALHGVEVAVDSAAFTAGRAVDHPVDRDSSLYLAQSVLRHAGAAEQSVDQTKSKELFRKAAAVCRLGETFVGGSAHPFDTTQALLCEGEASFHAGDLQSARGSFQKAVREGGAYHPRPVTLELAQATWTGGDRAQATQLFLAGTVEAARLTDTVYLPAGLEQLGTLSLDAGQPAVAIAYYDLAVAALPPHPAASADRNFTDLIDVSDEARLVEQRVHLNRGVARLRSLQTTPDTPPECAQGRDICLRAQDDFQVALHLDPANPVSLLDLGWAARLLHDPGSARTALRSASTGELAFNALNDLGVLEAQAGDEAAARRSFETALELKPDYDLAAWNLGVLFLRQWPTGLARGEAYLGRAVALNPELARADLEFRSDERTYRQVFGSGPKPQRGSANGPAAAIALAQVTTLTAPLVATPLQKVGSWLRDSLPDFIGRLQHRFRRRLVGPARHAWLVTVPFTALVAIVTAWPTSTEARLSTVTLALVATLFAVLVHECAHALAACRERVWIKPALWPVGIGTAVVLLPFRLSVGPFVGHRVEPSTPPDRAWWIVLAGPAANLGFGLAVYLLYRAVPVPAFRLIAQAQLLMLGFSLLPFRPLDGHALAARHRWVVVGLGVVVLALGSLVGIGEG
jgi:tetratricopeptide (TPR) repeat protein